jgi:hypothetical protein
MDLPGSSFIELVRAFAGRAAKQSVRNDYDGVMDVELTIEPVS